MSGHIRIELDCGTIERMTTLLLDKLLDPASLVVIGASAREDSPGYKLTRNLLQGGFKGKLFLVNPRYQSILDNTCYKSIKALPEVPELAIVITPARLVRRTLVRCAAKGTRVAVVMSGLAKSSALHRYAQRLGMRLMGPYCAGLIRPHIGLNASYSANTIEKGSLAIVSQSASLGAAMLDWAQSSNVGFSALLSTGEDTDISLSDLLDLLTEDWQTRAVIVYVNKVNGTRSFLSALSAAARIKPVVLMYSAQHGAHYCDALTRTGEVYSSDTVFQAALNRAGVVRIRTFQNLFAAAKILSTQIRVRGKRLAIISNGSAPAMMALERIAVKDFEAPQLDASTLKAWRKSLDGQVKGHNPLIIRKPTRLAEYYQRSIEALQQYKDIDAILIIFVPDSRNDPDKIAEAITHCMPSGKALLTCWMGDASVLSARELLTQAGMPTFRTPEAAVDGFDFLHRYFISQQQLLQLPNPASRNTRADASAARELVQRELTAGNRVLGPQKTRTLMELFDIPVLRSQRATRLDDALIMAEQLGYPLAMKLVSPNISYKASVIETQLNINTAAALTSAWHRIVKRLQARRPDAQFRGILLESMYEPANVRHLALSISRDSTFGPFISIGLGGDLTALIHQRSVQLPPLNQFLISEILKGPELQTYLGAFRHVGAVGDRPIAHILRRLSEMACELPEIFSLDINPLVLSQQGAVAMDIQVVLEKPSVQKRYGHLAIHPYPWQWVRNITIKNNIAVQLRPIRPDDAQAISTLVREMSAESRYFRFMHAINELSPQMVAQFTKLDYDRQMAIVATDDQQAVIGVSRYIISSNRLVGEFAISVSDSWKGLGLASALMRLLIEHAKAQGLEKLRGDVLRNNKPMQGLMKSLGFYFKHSTDEPEVLLYEYPLQQD